MVFLEISVATNDVWSDMSKYLNGAISKGALHLFVHNGRHDVKKALGLLSLVQDITSSVTQTAEELLQSDTGKTIITTYK